MPNPVVHFEICVKDDAKGVQFYTQLFDWKVKRDEKMGYNEVEAGPGGIGGGIFKSEEGKFPTYVTFHVQVDDIQQTLNKAVKLGGKLLMGVTPIPGIGSMGMFADLDGNAIGVYKSEK